MNINETITNRMKMYEAAGDALQADWKEMLDRIDENRAKKGESALSAMDRRNLAIVFENASMDSMERARGGILNETTDSSAISWVNVQLPIIAAMLPTSILNEIATVN